MLGVLVAATLRKLLSKAKPRGWLNAFKKRSTLQLTKGRSYVIVRLELFTFNS